MSLNISPDIATYAEQQHADEICRQRQFHEHEQPHRVDIRCHQRFTMFSQLPPEIRDMIWELAIHDCDAQPKAHWFSLQRCADNAGYPTPSLYTSYEPMESDHEGRIHANSDQQRRQSLTYLKIPNLNTPPKDDQLDEVCDQWDKAGNVSAYINTCALWTACPESCAAMIRQWRKDAHVRGNDARQVKLIKFETGHTSPFHLIDMQQDLLAIKTSEVSADLAQSILDIAKGGFCGSTVCNIGLEFRVEWDDILRLGSHGGQGRGKQGCKAGQSPYKRDSRSTLASGYDAILRPKFLKSEAITQRRGFNTKNGQYVEIVLEDMDHAYLDFTTYKAPAIVLTEWFHTYCGYMEYARKHPHLSQKLRLGVLARVPDTSE